MKKNLQVLAVTLMVLVGSTQVNAMHPGDIKLQYPDPSPVNIPQDAPPSYTEAIQEKRAIDSRKDLALTFAKAAACPIICGSIGAIFTNHPLPIAICGGALTLLEIGKKPRSARPAIIAGAFAGILSSYCIWSQKNSLKLMLRSALQQTAFFGILGAL